MIRFIHTADNHIGAPFVGLGEKDQAIAEKVRKSTYQAFENMITLAIENAVDFVLISGDLYDSQVQHFKEIIFVINQFKRLESAQIPVYLIHGNHDYEEKEAIAFPQNVFVFPQDIHTEIFESATKEKVAISGFSYPKRWVQERMASKYPNRMAHVDYHIGMYHGSLENSNHKTAYAPFSILEMREKNYDYWALGHIHKRQEISHTPPIVYVGNTQGFKRTEIGEKGVYLVTIESSQSPILEFLPTHEVQWMEERISFQHVTSRDESIERIKQWIDELEEQNKMCLISLIVSEFNGWNAQTRQLFYQDDVEETIRMMMQAKSKQYYLYKLIWEPIKNKPIWPQQEEIENSFQNVRKSIEKPENFIEGLNDLFKKSDFLQIASEWLEEETFKEEVFMEMDRIIQQEFLREEQ